MARFGSLGTQYFDNSGAPLMGGRITFYESGTTDVFKDTYQDSGQTILNTNPVILSAAGRQPNIYFTGSAKAILSTSAGVQIEVRDPVGGDGDVLPFGGWMEDYPYPIDAVVTGLDGEFYFSLVESNIENDPASSPEYWEIVKFIKGWNETVAYRLHELVQAADGTIYYSVQGPNLDHEPAGDDGAWWLPAANILSGLAPSEAGFIVGNGSAFVVETGEVARASLGVGTDDTPQLTNVHLTDIETGFVITGNSEGGAVGVNMTAKGALLVGDGVEAPQALPVGANTYVLTADSTAPLGVKWALTQGVGAGGTAITSDVTLIATSPAAMKVAPTARGMYATLPNATTCAKGATLWSFCNTGNFDYGIKDAAGTKIGWIQPGTTAILGLMDNSAAPGVWTSQSLNPFGVTAEGFFSSLTGASLNAVSAIPLDASRTCLVFGEDAPYAVVYDDSTRTWGAPTLIRSAAVAFAAISAGTNKVLVVSCQTAALEAVTLSISGTTVTVNSGTVATATLSASVNNSSMNIVAVGASWVVGYSRTGQAIRAITISGNTPTIGSESTLSTTTAGAFLMIASGSIVRTFAYVAATQYAAPYTVSGVTLTGGTIATLAKTGVNFKIFSASNGNVIFSYLDTSYKLGIFKLTGTTEAAASVATGITVGDLPGAHDRVEITSTKSLFIVRTGANVEWVLLTDTGGTPTIGGVISVAMGGTVSVAGLFASGNIAYMLAKSSSQGIYVFEVDCSGVGPVLNGGFETSDFGAYSSGRLGERAPQNIVVGDKVAVAGGAVYAVVQSGSARLINHSLMSTPAISDGARGAWGFDPVPGFRIQHIEAAP